MQEYFEAAAVVLAIIYLLLAVKQNIWCWLAAIISTSIYLVIFIQVNLYMEAILQLFYIIMAVYGYLNWRGTGDPSYTLPVTVWPLTKHLVAIIFIVLLTAITGFLLSNHSDASLPYLDAFTTYSAIFATWLITQKKLENWLYWVVIDAVSIYLYMDKALYMSAGLFVFYIIMCGFGYNAWKGSMNNHATA
jgi:nicotinamide mononucleotide transporter